MAVWTAADGAVTPVASETAAGAAARAAARVVASGVEETWAGGARVKVVAARVMEVVGRVTVVAARVTVVVVQEALVVKEGGWGCRESPAREAVEAKETEGVVRV